MDLKNKKVLHKTFGQGKIICHDNDGYITIDFQQSEKKFLYPEAFKSHLKIDDKKLTKAILKELTEKEEKQKVAAEEMRKAIELEREIEEKKKQKKGKTKVKAYKRENIAFKCNYCDGGKSDLQIGYNGVCSDNVIRNNIKNKKHTWCCSDECDCGKYSNGEINRDNLDEIFNSGGFVCYESQMLRDWKALAGIIQTGKNKGKPMKLNKVHINSLCVLTTRDPESAEVDRFIFAVFLVDETYQGDTCDEGYVTTNSKFKIKLTPKEANSMLFWNYYSNGNQPDVAAWSSGLHRYFSDKQGVQILSDISKLKKGTEDEKLAVEFLNYFARINKVDLKKLAKKRGALMR